MTSWVWPQIQEPKSSSGIWCLAVGLLGPWSGFGSRVQSPNLAVAYGVWHLVSGVPVLSPMFNVQLWCLVWHVAFGVQCSNLPLAFGIWHLELWFLHWVWGPETGFTNWCLVSSILYLVFHFKGLESDCGVCCLAHGVLAQCLASGPG